MHFESTPDWTSPMHESDLHSRLQALARHPTSRSKTARLRDVFEQVEAALDAGVSRIDVLTELNRDGFDMTLAGFKSALQRIRKEKYNSSTIARSNSEAALINLESPKAKHDKTPLGADYQRIEAMVVPENWMDADLTPAQIRMLTPAQRRKRTDAIAAQFFPNPFKPESLKG